MKKEAITQWQKQDFLHLDYIQPLIWLKKLNCKVFKRWTQTLPYLAKESKLTWLKGLYFWGWCDPVKGRK